MNTSLEGPPSDGDDSVTTAHLLQLAGVREEANPDSEQRARKAFIDECRALVRRRQAVRRTVTAVAGLSLAAAAVVAVRLSTTRDAPAPGATLATVVVLEGTARLVPEAEPPGPARNLAVAASIRTGDLVETSATGRLGLQLIGGSSVRLDVATRARLRPAAIELVEGAIYVDNPSGGAGLAVRTPIGTVQDIGTQFEVRVGPSSLRVRVRSGSVTLGWPGEEASASAGAELMVEGGRLVRREIAVHGPAWAWTLGLAPPIPMDGRTLEAVLEDLCREHGWTRRYAEPALRRDATTLILSGRLDGLSPEQALDAVFGATDLSYRLQNGEIVILRAKGRPLP